MLIDKNGASWWDNFKMVGLSVPGVVFVIVGAEHQEWFLIFGGAAIITTSAVIGCRGFGASARVTQFMAGFCTVLFGAAIVALLIGQ